MLQTDPHYVTTVLKLNQHEYHKLNWLSEHEFYYQNNVYDLFEADSLKNGDFLLSVFCDTEENEILEDMSSHENKKKDGEAFVRILLCTTWYNELNKLEAGLPKVIELFLARNTPEFHTSYGNLSELVHPPPAA